MELYKNTNFTLDKDSIELLKEFKKKYKIPKSLIVRTVLQQYLNKKDELYELLIGE